MEPFKLVDNPIKLNRIGCHTTCPKADIMTESLNPIIVGNKIMQAVGPILSK